MLHRSWWGESDSRQSITRALHCHCATPAHLALHHQCTTPLMIVASLNSPACEGTRTLKLLRAGVFMTPVFAISPRRNGYYLHCELNVRIGLTFSHYESEVLPLYEFSMFPFSHSPSDVKPVALAPSSCSLLAGAAGGNRTRDSSVPRTCDTTCTTAA